MRKMVVVVLAALAMLALAADGRVLNAVNLEASCATLDLAAENPSHYQNFLETIRDELSDGECFDVPMLRPPIMIGGQEAPLPIVRKIRSTNGKMVTLTLNSDTLNLIGYADQVGSQKRFFQFLDAPDYVFPGHAVVKLPYKSVLHDIASNAAIEVDELPVSRLGLDQLLDKVHGAAGSAEEFAKDQAQFLVMLMRMVVGGLRYKYIESQVATNYDAGVKPDRKWLHIENVSWDKLSAKLTSANKEGILPDFLLWPVENVAALKPDLAVVGYAKEGVCAIPPASLRTRFPFLPYLMALA